MSIERKAIRDAAVARIQAAGTALGARVFSNRVTPIQTRDLPAAVVFTRGETVSAISEAPRIDRRELRLVVHLVAIANEAVDDQLDALAAAVESAIYGGNDLGGLVSTIGLASIEGPELSDEGERITGNLALVWTVVYETEPREAEDASDDFATAHVEYETHAARTGPEAVDDLTLEVATP